MKFTNTVTINRGREQVFAFLSDFENLPLWNCAISHTRRTTSGPVGVGSRYEQTRTSPTRTVEEFEVTEVRPGQRLAIQGTLGPFRAEVTYDLDSAGEGTVVTNSMHLKPAGAFGLMALLAGSAVKSAVGDNLDALKHILEQGDAAQRISW